jgi:hypothetical protein
MGFRRVKSKTSRQIVTEIYYIHEKRMLHISLQDSWYIDERKVRLYMDETYIFSSHVSLSSRRDVANPELHRSRSKGEIPVTEGICWKGKWMHY